MREKRDIDLPKVVLVVFEIIILVLATSFIYLSRINASKTNIYSEHNQKQIVESLIKSLSLEKVHEIPYFGIPSRIQVYIRENEFFVSSFYFEISRGNVLIGDGKTLEEDVIIRTSKEEIEKIVEDSNYIKISLSSGKTSVEKVTSNFVLFTKGYPDIFLK